MTATATLCAPRSPSRGPRSERLGGGLRRDLDAELVDVAERRARGDDLALVLRRAEEHLELAAGGVEMGDRLGRLCVGADRVERSDAREDHHVLEDDLRGEVR